MSSRDLIPVNVTPAGVAVDLLASFKDIERLLSGSKSEIDKIEKRGWLKKIFSSSQDDLISISSSQNRINSLMLDVIQEVITFNTMSYSFLASVIAELEERARNGWKDAEGNFQTLSRTGQDFADKARHIFLKIVEGSKDTQQRIEMNRALIGNLQIELSLKDALDEAQSEQIEGLRNELTQKAAMLSYLEAQVQQQEALDVQQTQSIRAIVQRLSEMRKELEAVARVAAELDVQVATLGSLRAEQQATACAAADLHRQVEELRAQLALSSTALARVKTQVKLWFLIGAGVLVTLAAGVISALVRI